MDDFVEVRIGLGSTDEARVVELLASTDAEVVEWSADRLSAILPAARASGLVERLAALSANDIDMSPAAAVDDGAMPLASLRPCRVGPLWLVPAGQRVPPEAEIEPALNIDASTAFGSGQHPSTRLCIERIAEWPPTGELLDVGAGSGIISLAWLRLGGASAVATEVDPAAVVAATNNARRNGLADRLRFIDPTFQKSDQRFTSVVANIVAAPLIALAPMLVRLLGRSPRVLLSGVRDHQADDVLAAYRHQGLRAAGEWSEAGWVCLELSAPW